MEFTSFLQEQIYIIRQVFTNAILLRTMKSSAEKKLIAFLIALAVLFLGIAIVTSVHTYKQRLANESFDEVDLYSMHEFSRVNSEKVIQALKNGDSSKLEKNLISEKGVSEVMGFADWSSIDLDRLASMGSGSLSAGADSKGKMDISERWIVETAEGKYVFFIETLTSRWGRKNEGVSAVGVTRFEHFDELDYAWNGEADESSALAGELFWPTNQ